MRAKVVAAATLGGLIAEARRRLAECGVVDAGLEARLLVEHFTGTSRTQAIAAPQTPVSDADAQGVRAAVEKRAGGMPVHRILGYREFYGLKLALSPETLEPRPDTETLVDLVLPFARRIADEKGRCRILDLGTGTGAIALALLNDLPQAFAVGVDISEDALATAAGNADINGYGGRFRPLRSDWLAQVTGEFEIIVSNPPYIAAGEWASLSRDVREFDPRQALEAGADGLDAYRRIAASAAGHLADKGILAMEIGYNQKDAVTELFRSHGFRLEAAARDLAGHDRALVFAAASAS